MTVVVGIGTSTTMVLVLPGAVLKGKVVIEVVDPSHVDVVTTTSLPLAPASLFWYGPQVVDFEPSLTDELPAHKYVLV